jgi:hypothetical protein
MKTIKFTRAGEQEAEKILESLPKAKQLIFYGDMLKEYKSIYSVNHQMMTSADVIRVFNK